MEELKRAFEALGELPEPASLRTEELQAWSERLRAMADQALALAGDEKDARLVARLTQLANFYGNQYAFRQMQAAEHPEQLPAERSAPTRFTAAELHRLTLPEPRWAVPGLLPEGLTILAGRPKLGKSWLALQLALAVASGQPALGSFPVQRGAALYLALEDGNRRLQGRLRTLLGTASPPEGLHLWTECPRLDDGGLRPLIEWLSEQPDARLLVIDTLKRVRPQAQRGQPLYDQDYEALAPLATLAQRVGLALVIVHHTRKADAADPLDLISGTTGLTGAADGAWILDRARASTEATLHVVHRDLPEAAHGLRWSGSGAWQWLDPSVAAAARRSPERQQIVDLLAASGPLTPKAIAESLGRNASTTKTLLARMAAGGELVADHGRYSMALKVEPAAG